MVSLKIKSLIGLASTALLGFLAFQLNWFDLQDAYYGSKYFRPYAYLRQGMRDGLAIQLNDGRIFLPNWKHSEIFDPESKKSVLVEGIDLVFKRPKLLVLKDGNILFTNGHSFGDNIVACFNPKNCPYSGKNTRLFDISRNEYRWVPFDLAVLTGQTATLLPDGKVLMVGGVQYLNEKGELRLPFFNLKKDIAIYDPKTYKTVFIGKLQIHRFDHEAILLNNNQVLIIGGHRFGNSTDNNFINDKEFEKSIELVNYKTGVSKILLHEAGRNAMLLSSKKLLIPWSFIGNGKIEGQVIDFNNLNKRLKIIEKLTPAVDREGLGNCFKLLNDHAICPATTEVREFDPNNLKLTIKLDKMVSRPLYNAKLFYLKDSGYLLLGSSRNIGSSEFLIESFNYERYLRDLQRR